MLKTSRTVSIVTVLFIVLSLTAGNISAADKDDPTKFGFKIRMGGRFDNVRKCVASKTGTRGGIAADISAFVELPINNEAAIHIDLPVMRPILFAFAFKMLQFEPSVTFKFSDTIPNHSDSRWVFGPIIGMSLHYGPDYKSEASGEGRTPSFFAMGPTVGLYGGLDFARPDKKFNFQLGASPFVTPLFGINDSKKHKGVVVGGLLDGSFCYKQKKN